MIKGLRFIPETLMHFSRQRFFAKVLKSAFYGLFALSISAETHAGDAAEFKSLGFSGDERGRYFVFEEFGRQDGSGFPYSNIFMIDLAKDKWVDGTPVRIRLENEASSVLEARAQALSQASPIIQAHDVSQSGALLAASPVNEVGEKRRLSFRQIVNPMLGNDGNDPHRLDLFVEEVKDQNQCGLEDGMVKGFALELTKPDGSRISLHRDKIAPKSRGCPMDYHLVAVYAPSRYKHLTYAVALVGVFSKGFEGPDLRYIAVPFSF